MMRMGASKVLGAGAIVVGGLLLSAVAASPTWAATPSQQNGQYSQYDMGDIEYFNQVEFMGDVVLNVDPPTPQNYVVQLGCPQRQTDSFPPPTLDISLTTGDGKQTTDCSHSSLVEIDRKAAECSPTGMCDLLFKASNSLTGLSYSTTMTDLQLSQPQILIPRLNPATLPQNAHGVTLPPNEAASKGSATLQLCESAQQCASNSTGNTGYSYNTQVYFQTSLKKTVTD
jgi:hypothetical protein